MSFKHKWVYIAFILVLLPVTVYSQSTFYELPIEQTAYGFGLSIQQDATAISTGLDYALNKHSKISFTGGIGFLDDNNLESFGLSFTPSPLLGIGISRIKPLGLSGLEYFSGGGFSIGFFSIVDDTTNETLVRSRFFSFSGGGGILTRIVMESEWVMIPYFTLSYTRLWTTTEEETDSDGYFDGAIGLEVEISPTVSVKGSFNFSFQDSDTAFGIGINFH